MNDQDLRSITEALLRYHRKNPLRVAFGTSVLIAQHGGEQIERAYQMLVEQELVEPMHHTVMRNGDPRPWYRITKKGLAPPADE